MKKASLTRLFKQAAKITAEGKELFPELYVPACLALNRACISNYIARNEREQIEKMFRDMFGPLQYEILMDPYSSYSSATYWWGDRDKRNSLPRSLALLFMAEMERK